MKKRILSLLLASLMVLALSSCASGGTSEASAAPSDSSSASPEPSAEPADSTVYEFNLACSESSTAAFAPVLDQWVEDVKEASNGRILITNFYGGSLAAKADAFNMVEEGSIDFAWVGVSDTGGRCAGTEVFYLPYLGSTNSMQQTAAILDVYNRIDTIREEWSPVHMVALHANGSTPISTTSVKIGTADDLSGLRLRTGVANLVTFLENLKAVPTAFSPMESYENMSKNVVDGVCDDWTLVDSQNLREVVKYIMNVSVMIPMSAIVMSNDAYDKLPADLQKVIDDTSADLSFKMTEPFNSIRSTAAAEAAASGVEVYEPSAEIVAAFEAAAEYTKDQWIANMDKNGRDGQSIYDAAIAAIKANAAEYSKYDA